MSLLIIDVLDIGMFKTPNISGLWFRGSDKDEKERRIYEKIDSVSSSMFKTED